MRLKKIFILTGIFFLLILGVVVKEMRKPVEIATEDYSALNLSFDPQQITGIQIGHAGGEPVKLLREGDRWKAPALWNARADKAKIARFLRDIQQAQGELRAGDRFLFKDFGMEEDQAFSVSLLNEEGNDLLKIWIGNKKVNNRDVFVRNEGSEKIYLVSSDLLTPMGIDNPQVQKLTPGPWVSLNFLSLDTTQMRKLEARRLNGGKESVSFSLERVTNPQGEGKKRWAFSRPDAPSNLDQDKADDFLFSLNNLQAVQILDPKSYALDKPVWQMAIGLADGQEVILKVVPKKKDEKEKKERKPGGYILQVSTEPVLYEIAPYFFQSLDVEDSHFAVQEPKTEESQENK